MRNLTGKLVRHVDGRTAYVLSAKPTNNRIDVAVIGGAREVWGPEEVPIGEFMRALGIAKPKNEAPKEDPKDVSAG